MAVNSELARPIVPLVVWSLILLVAPSVSAQTEEDLPPPSTLEELEADIVEVLETANVPGLGISIVSGEEVLWQTGLGKADIEGNVDATADTLFRIGSISKTFIGIAISQLVEEGRLSLEDQVRALVPEIEFTNPWSDTDPVRVAHLLQHTSGFDDMHLIEYASSDPSPLTLREGLDLHPHSRTVRWRPGTRYSYSNAGPGVAAYIVEQITGQRFEDYVQEHIFDPLGMETASYFLDAQAHDRLATFYAASDGSPVPYWHISQRPVGAINASARDMAKFVQALLNRGGADANRILATTSVDRMERPSTTLGAQEGLELGYGLGLAVGALDGFMHYGHDGGMPGALALAGYYPEAGLGYALMINSSKALALQQIAGLVRGYLTRELEPAIPAGLDDVPELAAQWLGIYRSVSPRAQWLYFITRLNMIRLSIVDNELLVSPIPVGAPIQFVPVTERLARREEVPITGLAFIGSGGTGAQLEVFRQSWAKVPTVLAWTEVILALGSLSLMASSFLVGLVWVPKRLFGKLKGEPGISVLGWPVLAAVSFFATVILFLVAARLGMLATLGHPTLYSVGIMVLSYGFLVASAWSVFSAWRTRRLNVAILTRGYGACVAAASLLTAGYLYYWGIIGIQLWSV